MECVGGSPMDFNKSWTSFLGEWDPEGLEGSEGSFVIFVKPNNIGV